MAGHVFISHGSENRDEATELCAFIEARGVKCWIAPRDVRPGIDYSEELQAAIENAAAFVVLVTDHSNKSPYVRAETEMAFSSHKPIFPVRQADIKPAAGLALFLKIRHWTDAYGKYRDAAMDRLALELQTVVGVNAPPLSAPAPAAPPLAPAAAPPPKPAPAPPRAAPPPAPVPAAAYAPPPVAAPGPAKAARGPLLILLAVLAVVVAGVGLYFLTRPAQKPVPTADLPNGLSPRVGEQNDAPPTTTPGTTPGITPGTVPGVGQNGEVDEEALRNALNEARNLLEQQGQGRNPLDEALSVPGN